VGGRKALEVNTSQLGGEEKLERERRVQKIKRHIVT
jgi:hypothetical protein